MDDTMVITLLRHGMTEENERGAYIGWSNPSLSEEGIRELKKQKQQLVVNEIHSVFSSDLIRCVETAEVFFPNHYIQKMDGLRELNFGKWEGKSFEELKNSSGYRFWLDNLFTSAPEEGEHFKTFSKRIDFAYQAIKQKMLDQRYSNIVIVAHGGVLRYLLTKFVHSDKTYFDWKVPYGAGYQLTWSEAAFRRGELCTSLQEVPQMGRQYG
ncbi:histidine phosphatase family protein [Oceanobacillus sp. CAU 1775]